VIPVEEIKEIARRVGVLESTIERDLLRVGFLHIYRRMASKGWNRDKKGLPRVLSYMY